MIHLPKNFIIIGTVTLFVSSKVLAEPDRFSPQLEVSVARIQESSIVLDETDVVVESADGAYNSEAIIGLEFQPNQRLSLAARYVRNETRYETLADYDLITQLVSGSAAYTFNKFTVGVDAFAADADLGGEHYLQLLQTGPTLGYSFTRNFYLQTSLTHIERKFAENPERNTVGPQVGARLYYLLNGTDHYFLLNYKGRKEDADSDSFDSSVHFLGLSWQKTQDIYGKALDVSLGISQEMQTYVHQPTHREDQLRELQAGVTCHLNDHIYIKMSYQHLNNSSTDDTLDYQQHRAEARIGFYW